MNCPDCGRELTLFYGKLICKLCLQVSRERKVWVINPKTKIKDSKRKYNRQKVKRELKEENE